MKDFVSSSSCKRKLILNYFGHDKETSLANHLCCDNDAAQCTCDECSESVLSEQLSQSTLKTILPVSIDEDYDDDVGVKLLSISNSQKDQIRHTLENFMESLYFGPSCVGGVSLATGFTPYLIDKVVEQCEQLISVEAVEHSLPVFSKENAKIIFDIVKKFSS
jgi:hypothetical protein